MTLEEKRIGLVNGKVVEETGYFENEAQFETTKKILGLFLNKHEITYADAASACRTAREIILKLESNEERKLLA